MTDDRVAGAARNLGGKVEQDVGATIGDIKTQVAGIADQIKGATQEVYGQARDGAADIAGKTRDVGSSVERAIRSAIEQTPYTTVAIAIGVGWLLGRLHRPI